MLQTLVFPEYNKADPILPYHDEYIAFSVFNDIMKKYKERRDIMRSDEEFHELVKERIAMHAGFKNSKECFGDRVKTLRVPKIPRGKELVWLAIGDPDPVMSEDDKKLGEVLSDMALVVVQAFKDLYPELYAESKLTDIMDNKKDEDGNPSVRLVLNTSHTEIYNEIKQKALSCDFRGMKDVALPVLIDGMIIRPLTEKKQDNDNNQQDYVNAEERQKIFDNILNTWSGLYSTPF